MIKLSIEFQPKEKHKTRLRKYGYDEATVVACEYVLWYHFYPETQKRVIICAYQTKLCIIPVASYAELYLTLRYLCIHAVGKRITSKATIFTSSHIDRH